MSKILKVAKKVKLNKLIDIIVTGPIRGFNLFESKKISKKYCVEETFINERQVITLSRKENYNINILYFHGGSFTDEALLPHKIFIERILDKYDVKITFLDYPLTPENTYKEIHSYCLEAFKYLKNKYKDDIFYFMGDSAGGGLALSILQSLKKEAISIKKSVLLSPWVDVSMSNKKIKKQIKKDFTLNYNDLLRCGLNYSADLSTKDRKVSPLNGNVNRLGKFLIYCSDNELLYPDIYKLHKKIKTSKGSDSTLIIGKELCHVWPLLIIEESKGVIGEIMEFLLENS